MLPRGPTDNIYDPTGGLPSRGESLMVRSGPGDRTAVTSGIGNGEWIKRRSFALDLRDVVRTTNWALIRPASRVEYQNSGKPGS